MTDISMQIAEVLAIADELAAQELGYDEVCAIGLDGTGRDGDPRFPYTWANLTDDERCMLRSYWLTESEK